MHPVFNMANQQPRRQYNKYAYNNRYNSGGYQRQQQRGQSGGYNRGISGNKGTENQQAGTGAFLDTRRLILPMNKILILVRRKMNLIRKMTMNKHNNNNQWKKMHKQQQLMKKQSRRSR